ncbi:MAG: saccharopine dehydrogenase C-terminal domain-containing protein, partial [Butyricicoccus sp.]
MIRSVRRTCICCTTEIESLGKNLPEVKRIRFFMTFGETASTTCARRRRRHLSTTPIHYNGQEIVPIQFLKALLPDPASLGPRTKGKTNIGCIFTGKKDGKEKTYYIYNVCDHQECYREVGSQAISYTTGVPAMCGALMMLTGKWTKPGVYTVEEFDPDPFLDALDKYGLPRKIRSGFGGLMSLLDTRPPFAGINGEIPPEFKTLSTPCYLMDEAVLQHNAEVLGALQKRTGCKVLLAQKAFSNYNLYPIFAPHLAGTEASGLFEARLGAEEMPGGEVHVFCAAYREDEMDELLRYADH